MANMDMSPGCFQKYLQFVRSVSLKPVLAEPCDTINTSFLQIVWFLCLTRRVLCYIIVHTIQRQSYVTSY